jgi:hypothetical protein
MNCLRCCMSQEKINRRSLKKSIKEYHDTKTLASFAKLSFKSGKFVIFNVIFPLPCEIYTEFKDEDY